MEDGVLIAPAPYSNPAAYYFPTTLRMHTIEVLKGAPLLRYGPQTTGGVINMVSTPIPDQAGGGINFSYGENAEMDLLASYGVTGVTDTTPTNDNEMAHSLRRLQQIAHLRPGTHRVIRHTNTGLDTGDGTGFVSGHKA